MRHALPIALAAALAAGSASAQSPADETEHQRGVQLRAQGRHAEAVEVFRAIFERTGDPRALARLGLAEGALARWIDADEHLATALARASDPWIAANRASLAQALAAVRAHLGAVRVSCAAEGATVQVGDAPPQPLPLRGPLRVATGFVTLVVRAPGLAAVERRVAVPAGEDPIAVEVTLAPGPEAHPTSASQSIIESHPTSASQSIIESHPTSASPPAPPAAVARPTPRGTWRRPLGVGLLAGAGAAVGLGIAGIVLRQDATSRFNDAGCLLHPTTDALTTNTAACREHLAATQTGTGIGIGGFVAAGVLGVAGAAVLLLAPRATEVVRAGLDVDARGVRGEVTVRF